MLGNKSAGKNWLAIALLLLLIVGLIVALLFLPQPWRDVSFSSLFLVFSLILWINIFTWPRRKRRAGSLLWNLGRPSTYRTMLIASLLFVIGAVVQTIIFVDLIRKGFYGSYSSPEYYLSQIILYWTTAFYFYWAGLSRLQLRENGIYFKFGLIQWEQIASYKWEGQKGNTLTVWLNQRFPLLQTRSWTIPLIHKPTIERILDQHLSGQTRKARGYS
jgi:uncharacterized membrane protein YobD (UPF0266 family)